MSFLFMIIIKASQRRDIIHQVSSAQAAAADGMCCMLEAFSNSIPSFHNIWNCTYYVIQLTNSRKLLKSPSASRELKLIRQQKYKAQV